MAKADKVAGGDTNIFQLIAKLIRKLRGKDDDQKRAEADALRQSGDDLPPVASKLVIQPDRGFVGTKYVDPKKFAVRDFRQPDKDENKSTGGNDTKYKGYRFDHVAPPKLRQVTENVEIMRAGDVVVDKDGVVWFRQEGGGWYSPKEDYVPGAIKREDAEIKKTIDGGGMVQFKGEELAAIRTSISKGQPPMKGRTFIDEKNGEWHCTYAGQLEKLSISDYPREVFKGKAVTVFLNKLSVPWRAPITVADGKETLQGEKKSVTVDGVTYTRTEYGIQVQPSAEAQPGAVKVKALGVETTVKILDPEAVPVRAYITDMEQGKTQNVSISPAEAAPYAKVAIKGESGMQYLGLKEGDMLVLPRFTLTRTASGIRILATGVTPDQGKERIIVGNDDYEFRIEKFKPKFLSFPANLAQGQDWSISQVEPHDAPVGIRAFDGQPVDLPAANGQSVTVDGVTYKRVRYGEDSKSYIQLSAAPGAVLGSRVLSIKDTNVSVSFSVTEGKPKTEQQKPGGLSDKLSERPRQKDYLLADPADYEKAGEKPLVPAGTVRILNDGTAWYKVGQGHREGKFEGWSSLGAKGQAATIQHEEIRQKSDAQVDAAQAKVMADAVQNETEGVTVTDISVYKRTWVSKKYPEGMRWYCKA